MIKYRIKMGGDKVKVHLSRKRLDKFPEDHLTEIQEDLVMLDVSRNSIQIIPSTIINYQRLIELDISNNRVYRVPDEIVHLKNLRTLVCKNNRLNCASLPKDFGRCPALETVNFSGNLFIDFPMQFCEIKSITCLHIGGNRIRVLPNQIRELERLEHLYFGGNQLSSIPAELGDLQSLVSLVLCDNRIETLPPELTKLKRLKSLSLHNNQLRTLPPEIISFGELCELSLRGNPLVVRFVRDLTWQPPSLLEMSARVVKNRNITYTEEDLPRNLISYLNSAHRCLNPNCNGVYFESHIEHVKFVDFCGKYRLPLMQYLCSPNCTSPYASSSSSSSETESEDDMPVSKNTLKMVLLG
ncbi:uncharacterized protein [Amphiura filiformis]|uniref:uncharacterized protein n=1 Tax=Amphiura filiformis TaxID=82378 RepID=UPI003B20FD92